MNAPFPIRAKLITAALSLVLLCGFSTFYHIESRSGGEIAFRVCCMAFGTFLAFGGVFGNAGLQLFWGWGLAVAAPCLAALCIFMLRGSDLIFGLLMMAAAVVGGYLLLMDSSVRVYRESLRR